MYVPLLLLWWWWRWRNSLGVHERHVIRVYVLLLLPPPSASTVLLLLASPMLLLLIAVHVCRVVLLLLPRRRPATTAAWCLVSWHRDRPVSWQQRPDAGGYCCSFRRLAHHWDIQGPQLLLYVLLLLLLQLHEQRCAAESMQLRHAVLLPLARLLWVRQHNSYGCWDGMFSSYAAQGRALLLLLLLEGRQQQGQGVLLPCRLHSAICGRRAAASGCAGMQRKP